MGEISQTIRRKCQPVHHKPCKMLVLIRKQPLHLECAQVAWCLQKMLIPYHQKFIWEHTHQFWRMAFFGSETKFLIRRKERIIDGSGVFRAPGNHPHSIQVSILLLKGTFIVNLPGEHFSYCLIWDGWELTKRASQSFNCQSWLCAGHLLDASKSCCDVRRCFWRLAQALLQSTPHPSSISRVSKNQEQAYSLMLIRLSE